MTWLDLPDDHPYGVHHLPYGVFAPAGDPGGRRVGVRVGDQVLDLARCAAASGRAGGDVWAAPTLNPFLAHGHSAWQDARDWLTDVLGDAAYRGVVEPHLHPLADVATHLPVAVADYVDFYASEHHASNVGRIFRPDSPALPVNWKHLPIGYHGRAGTVVVSGTDIVRPCGQRKGPQDAAPVYGPSIRLDIEAELGFVVGGATTMGERVRVEQAEEHLFGVVILNDWSARDIQAWEYVPLGPFLGKSFGTSISAWVTPMAALQEAKCPLPGQDDPPLLPYLRPDPDTGLGDRSPAESPLGAVWGLDVRVEVAVNATVVTRPAYRDMYWSPTQMLAHLTVNGASVRDGDLFGSGTISGPDRGSRGSFLELAWGGTEPFALADGATRTYLEDGDEVVMTASATGPGGRPLALGEVSGRIRPAR